MVASFRKFWSPLAQVAVVIGVTAATFLSAPPVLSPDSAESESLIAFLRWLVAIGAGAATVLLGRHRRAHRILMRVCIVAALVATTGFAGYQFARTQWSVPYAGDVRIVIGSQLTEPAKAAIRRLGGQPSGRELLAWFEGRSEDVWEAGQVRGRANVLSVLFSFCWLAVGTAMIALISALGAKSQDRGSSPGTGRS